MYRKLQTHLLWRRKHQQRTNGHVHGAPTRRSQTRHKLTLLPEVLFLQLVRWTGSTTTDGVRDRVIPDLALSVQGARYHLRSVVMHSGPSAESGHFFTYARHEGEAEGWFRKNWAAAALIPLTPHIYLERICVLMNVAQMFVVSGVYS